MTRIWGYCSGISILYWETLKLVFAAEWYLDNSVFFNYQWGNTSASVISVLWMFNRNHCTCAYILNNSLTTLFLLLVCSLGTELKFCHCSVHYYCQYWTRALCHWAMTSDTTLQRNVFLQWLTAVIKIDRCLFVQCPVCTCDQFVDRLVRLSWLS